MSGMYHDKNLKHFSPPQSDPKPSEPMAHKPGNGRPHDSNAIFIIIAVFVLGVLCVLIGWWQSVMRNQTIPPINYQPAPVFTNTPIPTSTPLPSLTPYPTQTHNEPTAQVIIHDIEIEVTRIVPVEVLVEADCPEPEPTQPARPTPVPTQTPNATATQAERDSVVNYRNETLKTAGYAFGGFILGLFLTLWIGGSIIAMIESQKVKLEDTLETADDILSAVPGWQDEDILAAYLMGRGDDTRSGIASKIFGQSGGNYIPRVNEVGYMLAQYGYIRKYPPRDGEKVG